MLLAEHAMQHELCMFTTFYKLNKRLTHAFLHCTEMKFLPQDYCGEANNFGSEY